jgi:hypothetical protein
MSAFTKERISVDNNFGRNNRLVNQSSCEAGAGINPCSNTYTRKRERYGYTLLTGWGVSFCKNDGARLVSPCRTLIEGSIFPAGVR